MTRSRVDSIHLSLYQAAILLVSLYKAAKDPKIGHQDIDYSFKQLVNSLSGKGISVRKEVIESALYSCNMLSEDGKFWHPEGKSFNQFTKTVIGSDMTFDSFYNLIRSKNER